MPVEKRCLTMNLGKHAILVAVLLLIGSTLLIFFENVHYDDMGTGRSGSDLHPCPADTLTRASAPDLEVGAENISVLPSPVKAGDTCFITADVFNKGNAAASLVNVTFSIDGVPLGTPVILAYLGSNSSDNATKMWQPQDPGNHTVGVELDPQDNIVEKDENNNEASIVITVHTSGNVPPSVNITYPTDRESVRGTAIITGNAHDSPLDENELERVDVRIDSGNWSEASGLQAWQYPWDTTSFSEGMHTISARSYDGLSYSEVETVEVIVDNDLSNQPPTAVISPLSSYNYSVNESIFLSGNGSLDPDDGPEPLNYTWDLGDGTILYGPNVNHSYSSKSPLVTITLSAYDGDREDSDTVQIRIDNTPPVAVAGSDRTAELGETITFDGSASYDPDEPLDTIAESDHRWDMGNGDVLVGPVVNYSYEMGGGSYEVVLTVTDGKGTSNSDSLVVTLDNVIPVAVLTLPSHSVYAGTDLFFSAVDSSDPDGEVEEFYFDFGDGHTTHWLTSPGANHTYVDAGEYHPRLKVKDSLGGVSLWNVRDITVIPLPNERPGVTVNSPLPGSVVSSPLTVSGNCSDADPGDEIVRVEVSIENITVLAEPDFGPSLSGWKASFSDISSLPNGPATVKARAFDGKAWSSLATFMVEVNNDPPESIDILISEADDAAFPGEEITGSGRALYDTGVAVSEAPVACTVEGESWSGQTDINGLFSFSLTVPDTHGEKVLRTTVEKDGISGHTERPLIIYRVDFFVDADTIRIYRDGEEVIGYNDAVREGETVELRVKAGFQCDATEGPTFQCSVNVTSSLDDERQELLVNHSLNFEPRGGIEETELTMPWSPEAGTHTIEAVICAGLDVVPGNDTARKKFTVREEDVRPDFVVESIQVSGGEVREGSIVTVSVTVANVGDTQGLVNLSLYAGKEEKDSLVEKKTSILLKPGASQTIPFNWGPESGHVNLIAVVESTMDEGDADNNRKSLAVKVFPPDEGGSEDSYFLLTVVLIGIILVTASAAWVYLRRKEEEEVDGNGEGGEERVEFGTVLGEVEGVGSDE